MKKKSIILVIILFLSGCGKTDTEKYVSFEKTLGVGVYIAGIDFPTGVYDFEAINGSGNVFVYPPESFQYDYYKMLANPIPEMFKNIAILSDNNITFNEGDLLSIDGNLEIKISSNKVLLSSIKNRVNTATSTFEITDSGTFVVGVDFQTGIYDIKLNNGTCMITGGQKTAPFLLMLSLSDVNLPGYVYSTEYKNSNLKEGSTLTVSGFGSPCSIKLVPSK